MMDENMNMAHRLAQAVKAHGGTAYYVGGLVRDRLMGRENKDVDVEVHGVEAALLEEILGTLGEKTQMGVSFGVYGLRHFDIDIALPRRETATGRGHRDFAVFADPFLGTQKAAMRRDFTINAMMEDVLTGEIVDHFGGREDLARGVVRHVNDATFSEDPLRVLRAAQFAARFDFDIAPETIALCRRMDLTTLARERIFSELAKALMKAEKPSVFFEALRQAGQLHDWFAQVEALIGVEQEKKHHPEGDVWNHTMLVLDQAAKLRDQAQEPLAFMLSALCHDLGKPAATAVIDGVIRSFGHELKGVEIAQRFLERLTGETKLKRYVANMVRLHMRPNMLVWQKSGDKAYSRLFDEALCPRDLLLLAKADYLGRDIEGDYEPLQAQLEAQLARFEAMMAQSHVRGADLVAAGVAPDRDFSAALAYAHNLRLAGVDRENALRQTLAFIQKERKER